MTKYNSFEDMYYLQMKKKNRWCPIISILHWNWAVMSLLSKSSPLKVKICSQYLQNMKMLHIKGHNSTFTVMPIVNLQNCLLSMII